MKGRVLRSPLLRFTDDILLLLWIMDDLEIHIRQRCGVVLWSNLAPGGLGQGMEGGGRSQSFQVAFMRSVLTINGSTWVSERKEVIPYCYCTAFFLLFFFGGGLVVAAIRGVSHDRIYARV